MHQVCPMLSALYKPHPSAEYTGFKPDNIKTVRIEREVFVQKLFSKIFGQIEAVLASAGNYSEYQCLYKLSPQFFFLNIFISTLGIVENYPTLECVHPDCF